MATPSSPVTPTPLPPPRAPVAGWATPQNFLTALAIVVNGLLVAGVIPAASEASRVAMMILTALGAFGYHANVASAQRAYLRAHAAYVASIVGRASLFLVGFLLTATIGSLALSSSAGCTGAAAQKFGSCSVTSLEGDVGIGSGANMSVEQAVENALASSDYLAEITQLIVKIGEQEVACAVIAIDDFAGIAPAGSGGGSGSNSAPELTLARAIFLKARADVVIANHRWR